MDIEKSGNLIEAGLWIVIAAVVAFKAWREHALLRRIFVILAVAFFAFGLSDAVESHTGAWWRPWWLLLWKTVCVLAFILCFWKYYSLRK
jgi:hypothetical protein